MPTTNGPPPVDGVTQWDVTRDAPVPWDYAEVTEVHASETPDEVLMEPVLWSDGSSLSARGNSVRVTQKV